MFDACSGAVLANLGQNSVLTVEDDLADAFGALVLGNVDLDDLDLWLEIIDLHLVVEWSSSYDLAVAHLEF